MPSRVIKETIKTSKNVNALSDFQFRVWIHLILSADDYGRGNADPELVKNLAFPRRKGITEKQLFDALHVLANMGMVSLYEVDGEPYYYFPKWSEHQRVRQKVSKFPAPEDADKLRRVAADCGELPQIAADGGEVRPEYRIQNTEYGIQNTEYRSAVLEKWNSIAVNPIRSLNGSRETHLKERIRENGLETVLEAIDHISKSDFLQGKNSRGWTITFDWFVNPTNFQKVLEGNYDRKGETKKIDTRDLDELLRGLDKSC